MRILLTGASGMVGKNLLEDFRANEHIFFTPNRQKLNLMNYDAIFNYLTINKVEGIIHCAGRVAGIQANIQNPVEFLNENLQIGLNVINAGLKAGVEKTINLGSSCMYPKDYRNPLREEYLLAAPLEPTNEGYALAKISIAKLCEYMTKQYGVNYKTIIPCNLYGRWDKFDETNSHLIPAIIKKIYEAKKNNSNSVEIWGDGTVCREFMYTMDLVDSIFFMLDNFHQFDNYTNIGLGYDYSITEYYENVADVIGYDGIFIHNLQKPVGMQKKVVDVSKITKLGWKASTNLKDGIKKTYEFFVKEYKYD